MLIRAFDSDQDYADVSSWWEKQGWPVLSLEMLGGSGFIVSSGEYKMAASWVFSTNSPIYIMEWTVGNPEVSWEDRAKAIDLVIETGANWAKNNGAKWLLTMTKNKRFIEKLELSHFIQTDQDMTHLLRSL